MRPGRAKILFDECIPRAILDRLSEFIGSRELQGVTLSHLFDDHPAGTFDEVWIPRLKDAGWTVVSADGGRKPNKKRGKKLPDLCVEFGITLILLSPAIHNRKSLDKARTILSVWDQIMKIASEPSCSGKRYALEPMNAENLGIGRLVERAARPKPPKSLKPDDERHAAPEDNLER